MLFALLSASAAIAQPGTPKPRLTLEEAATVFGLRD